MSVHRIQQHSIVSNRSTGTDPGIQEKGFICIKVWGVHFADYIFFHHLTNRVMVLD